MFSAVNSFIATPFPGIGGGEPRTVAFWVRTTDADAYYMAWGSNETARKVIPSPVNWLNSTANSLRPLHLLSFFTPGILLLSAE